MSPARFLMDAKTLDAGRDMQRETPLTSDDVLFLAEGSRNPLDLAQELIKRKQPRWLMGWRDICRSTDERTVIASVFPKVGVGHTAPLFYVNVGPKMAAAKLALWTSLSFDYVARISIGGTHLTYSYLKQFPVFPPSAFTVVDLAFITSHVLELTYTSNAMRLWAEDLGHIGPPFAWDDARRAKLRAELDALFALKYGLNRDELRYVLDPAEIKGVDYPSETFRVLKTNEERRFGEYRTGQLVLEAFDQLSRTHITTGPIVLRPAEPVALRDGAWARSAPSQTGDVGAALAAILKAMGGPRPVSDVRFVAALVLEPRLLVPLLQDQKALEWRRLVGSEAEPLVGNVSAFATRNNAAWGAAIGNHRGNGRLIENLQSGTWAPGSGLDAIDTTGWPDGRAVFVWTALGSVDFGTAMSSLPDEMQQWITDAAAA